MQEVKVWYLHIFLRRTQENSLEVYANALRGWEDEIRCSYSETILMDSDELVSMILTDACFTIEFFLAFIGPSDEDHLVKKQWLTGYIIPDLILLENQLPFLVLDRLFDLAFPKGFNGIHSFGKVTFKFFRRDQVLFHPFPNKQNHRSFTFSTLEGHYRDRLSQVDHFIDMLRMFYIPSELPLRKSCSEKLVYSASQLREAGIEFKAIKQGKSITEVQYSNGLLTIPIFRVSDWTETMIRNVVAFELCHHPSSSYVTDYIFLLDHVISTEKDVEMLVKKGIIQNFLSDNSAVASMVNSLCKNVISTSLNSKYISLFEDLNRFYDNSCHKYKAIFRHEYLRTPWRIASFFAAILLLLLSLIQTICSIIPLFTK